MIYPSRLMISVVLVLTLLALSAASCSKGVADDDRLGVIVSILPQAEFLEKVGGDRVDVTVMVPYGADPHYYEPSPVQMMKLARSSMYVKVGSGIEFELFYLDQILAQNRDMIVVDCSRGITLLPADHDHAHEPQNNEQEEEHATDPHIWLSPVNARIMVQNIFEGLVHLDPEGRGYYEENRDAYLQELRELDEEIRAELANSQGSLFLSYHDFAGYFAEEYGLNFMAIEVEGKDLSPLWIQEIVQTARSMGVKVIFSPPQSGLERVSVIAREIGAGIVEFDPLARHYVENMRVFARELIKAS
ncbi:MAG: zinc ABC transporter substrate-binding protein [Dehalococcoidia bacterium]|nr:zinc ABC transporter substrate-binding protein [Dehalococcoidia bacterium]